MVTVFWVTAEKSSSVLCMCLTVFLFLSILQLLKPFKGSLNEGQKHFPTSCEYTKNRAIESQATVKRLTHSHTCKFTNCLCRINSGFVQLTHSWKLAKRPIFSLFFPFLSCEDLLHNWLLIKQNKQFEDLTSSLGTCSGYFWLLLSIKSTTD